MTTDATTRPLRSAIVTIALLSAAMLAFQLLVLRVAAVRLHFHFGLLLVGNSLLGIGLAGAVLAMCERSWRLLPEVWSRRACLGFLVSLPLAWSWLLAAPVPTTLRFEGAADWLQFASFAGACALPFVFGGAGLGLLLSAHARSVHAVHGSDLFGAGIACAVTPFLLWHVGAGGCFLVTLVLAAAATAAAGPMEASVRAAMMLLCAGAGFWMPRFDAMMPIDGPTEVQLGSTETLAFADRPIWSQWSADARIDIMPLAAVELPPAPAGEAVPLPPLRQWWLALDGDAGSLLSDFGGSPVFAGRLAGSCTAAALHLKQGSGAKVCILGLGGGADAWTAKISDASRIRAIEPSRSVIDAHRTVAKAFSQPLLDDPRVDIVCDDGRAALMRSDERYDVIQTTDTETWTSLHSGAQALAENYLYTVDAFRTMYDRLADGGILQITRLAAGPETIRLLNNLWHALPDGERSSFATAIAALRTATGDQVTVLLKKGGFAPTEATRLRQFAKDGGIDAIVLPDSDLRTQVEAQQTAVRNIEAEVRHIDGEIAIRNEGVDDKELQRLGTERSRVAAPLADLRTRLQVAEFVLAADKQEFAAGYPFDVSPTTDDRPYFFDFARTDATAVTATTLVGEDSSTGLLRWQLSFSLIAAALFLALPILLRGGAMGGTRRGALRFSIYFSGLALGTVGMQVALVQKVTLLLGQPVLSIAVTLGALFVFGGVGAWLSHGLLNWEPERGRFVAIGLFVGAGLVAFLNSAVVDLCIGLSLPLRIGVTALLAAPMGLLLGMPLPHGIRIVERINPSLVPWAFAVTASACTIGALLAVWASMAFGFAAVLFAAGVLFLVAFVAIDSLARADGETAGDELSALDGDAAAVPL